MAKIENKAAFRANTVGFNFFQLHTLLPTLTVLDNLEVTMAGRRIFSGAAEKLEGFDVSAVQLDKIRSLLMQTDEFALTVIRFRVRSGVFWCVHEHWLL